MPKPLLASFTFFLLVACSASATHSAAGTKKDAQGAAVAASASAADQVFSLGVNVPSIDYYNGSRPFLNLIYGSSWQMQNTNPWGGYEDVPASSLDANGWVQAVPVGYRVIRGLSVPLAGGSFVCRYNGTGSLQISGAAVSNASSSAGVLRFNLTATYPNPQSAMLSYTVDAKDYIRNIDCREASASTTDVFAPEFLSALTGFRTIRVMKWQTATEGNWPVSWAARNKPGDGNYLKNDGVPIELLVQLANTTASDLWVTVPWNADDDYVTRFATYVRDNLKPDRHVIVEVSNEVWNGGYPVAAQAAAEAKAENLPSASGTGTGGNLERYAEKTTQTMAIWKSVFAGQSSRLVRVASFQHVATYFSNLILSYGGLDKSIDAMATAPYFGFDLTSSSSADDILTALPAKVTSAVNTAVQQKAIATQHGLRYLTYEAGQHLVFADNVSLEQQVERDPRMYDIYRQFITSWQSQIGGPLSLFALTGGIGPYGSWGLVEYAGQPISKAPKMRAVADWLGLSAPATTVTGPGSATAGSSGGPAVVTSPVKVCPGSGTAAVVGTC